MSTRLLFQGYIRDAWVTLGIQTPGMAPATISDNRNGGRDVYVTQCFDDHATISRLPFGIDVAMGIHRIFDANELAKATLVKRLNPGEYHEMRLKPDNAPAERVVRYVCEN